MDDYQKFYDRAQAFGDASERRGILRGELHGPRAYACPSCKAERGVPCTGKPRQGMHAPRKALYQQAINGPAWAAKDAAHDALLEGPRATS